MTERKYCGYVCDEALEQQQKIVDELLRFQEEDPEYGRVMYGKLLDILSRAKK